MPYLSALADVAHRTGYPVTEVSGWAQRGHGPQPAVRGIVAHHTAGATGGGDYPSLAVVRDGRPGLSGPLSHFGIGRSGRIYVIAAGRCWHNAPSTSSDHTNSNSIGIEAENDGRQAWPAAQLDAYYRLCGELCREYGLSASAVKGHKEVNTQKPDPHSVSMSDFRDRVADVINGQAEEDPMAQLKHVQYQGIALDAVIPRDEWRYLPFNRRYPDDIDETYYSVVFPAAYYWVSAGLVFDGSLPGEDAEWRPLDKGCEVQIELVEVTEDNGEWKVTERAPIDSTPHVAGGGHFAYSWVGNNQDGHRVRLRVKHASTHPARLISTRASVFTVPR